MLFRSRPQQAWPRPSRRRSPCRRPSPWPAPTPPPKPRAGPYRYYKLDVKAGYGSSVQLSEISLKGAYISPSKYDILFTGDWKDVTVDGYLEELTKLFYNSYPRLYQRWGNGTEPTTITFKADNNYDGVAYCQGTTVFYRF